MMPSICAALLLVAALAGRLRLGRWLNPVSILAFVWMGAIGANRLPALELFMPSDETFVLFTASALTFCAGFLVLQARNGVTVQSPNSLAQWLVFNKSEKVTALQILIYLALFVIMAKAALASLSLVAASGSADVSQVRSEYYATGGTSVLAGVGGVFAGKYGTLIFNYLVIPGVFFAFALSLVRCLAIGRWPSYLALSVSLLNMIFLDMASVGRSFTIFALAALAMTVAFVGVSGAQASLTRSFRRFVGRVLTVGIVLVVCATIYRLGGSSSKGTEGALRSLFTYYGGAITALDQRDAVLSNCDDKFLYSIGGFCDLFNEFWRLILRHQSDLLPRTLDLQTRIEVGPGIGFNAMYSWCIYFIKDFGAAGVFVIPFIWGLIVGSFYRKYQESKNLSFMIVFVFFYTFMLWGVSDWRLGWGGTMSALMAVYLLRCPWPLIRM
jgi:oligosaccharide repeat unit polymerase